MRENDGSMESGGLQYLLCLCEQKMRTTVLGFAGLVASASAFTPMARPVKAAVKMSATNAVRGVPLLKG